MTITFMVTDDIIILRVEISIINMFIQSLLEYSNYFLYVKFITIQARNSVCFLYVLQTIHER